jgi:hypothetical protein
MQPFNEKKPAGLSSEILKVLARVSPDRDLSGHSLAQAIISLSRFFTTDRSALPPRYLDDPAHAAAYLSYFLPVNLPAQSYWTSYPGIEAWGVGSPNGCP